jgi:hypothetical protein
MMAALIQSLLLRLGGILNLFAAAAAEGGTRAETPGELPEAGFATLVIFSAHGCFLNV